MPEREARPDPADRSQPDPAEPSPQPDPADRSQPDPAELSPQPDPADRSQPDPAGPSPQPGRRSPTVRRVPLLVLIAGLLIVGGLVDRTGGARVTPALTAQAVQPVPVAAPAAALSSSWFCAGATDSGSNPAAGHIAIANEGSATVTATVDVVGSNGSSADQTVSVAPGAVTSVAETFPSGAPWTGAIIDAEGGMVAVSQVDDSALGRAVSPCATSGSRHWYLPAGQTRVNVSDTILLLNPYPTDSIVDMAFATDQGSESPQEFQSIDVPADGLVAENLGDHLRRRQSIATTVTARTGNVVAWETEIVGPPPANAPLVGTPAANAATADPASPDPGLAVTLGAPSTGTSWTFPDGLSGNGIDEQYLVYNPGPRSAAVRLSVGLEQGSAEPFQITVAPYSESSIVADKAARIPGGVPHTATLVSTNGVPVVAARTVAATKVATGSVLRSGIGTLIGERLAALRWVVPVTATTAGHLGQVVVANPGLQPVTVTVADGNRRQSLTVPGGGRAAVGVPSEADQPVTVEGPAPVYVEYDLFGSGSTPGFSLATAVPLS